MYRLVRLRCRLDVISIRAVVRIMKGILAQMNVFSTALNGQPSDVLRAQCARDASSALSGR
jgi:hypothetical protein